MRFLKVGRPGELTLTKELTTPPTLYAALSHTWGTDDDEVTFADMQKRERPIKAGYKKLHFCVDQARKDGLEYVWVDTCCINKTNSVELDEAIRSMFCWYQKATKCYVYLSDVTVGYEDITHAQPQWLPAFQTSKWFRRGWTLQELLAPRVVEFFSQDGLLLGTKWTLEQQIYEITEIPHAALRGELLSNFSIDDRLQWAKKRETTKIEDKAYCLFGIFNVFMPVMYGEGNNAFRRLKEEIGITINQIDMSIQQTYDSGRLVVERLSGKSLPLENCFVNLCIIDHDRDSDIRSTRDTSNERLGTGQLLSPFSLGARLKVETPPQSKQVSLETLFDLRIRTDDTKFRPSRVLIWGRAGMGKTTLCKKMVHDFYCKGLWKDLYDRVVWLPLRRLKLVEHEAHDIIELLQNEFSLRGAEKNLTERLQKVVIEGKRTLFILDGLDEVSYILDPDSSIGRILNSLLARPNIIITSRPHSTSMVDHSPPDLELETIGFFPQQVNEYIQHVTKQTNMSERTALGIQSFIENRPLVQSLARIPIQLDAICYAWGMKHFPRDNVNMTTLYQAISRRLWAKDIHRLRKKVDGQPMTKHQIENSPNIEVFVETENKFLQELGFQGLCKEVTEFDIGDIERLQTDQLMSGDILMHSSFLRSSDNSLDALNCTRHFIHLTFQEYFAARCFVRHWTSGTTLSVWRKSQSRMSATSTECTSSEEFLRTEKYISRYNIFWRFVVGLLHTETDHSHLHRFFRVLEEEPLDLIGLTHQRLTIHCLSEISIADSKFQHEVRKREQHYIKWVLYESIIGKKLFQVPLMCEMECSDYILESLLKNSETKTEAMKMLRNRPSVSSNVLDVVSHTLSQSKETKIRQAAIRILGEKCSHSQEAKFLVLWHSVSNLSVTGRLEIVQALMRCGKLQLPAVEALVTLLQDPDMSVRSEAASALHRQTSLPGPAVEALVTLLQHRDRSVRSQAASALGSQTSLPGLAVKALVTLLQHRDRSVRSQAASALRGQTSLPGLAVEALVTLLEDPDKLVRSEAASILYRQTSLPGPAVEALVTLLQDPDRSVRFGAASALRSQTSLPGLAVEALVELLQDPDGSVRSQAASALRSQTSLPGLAVEALVELLQDPDGSVRSDVMSVLDDHEEFYHWIPNLGSVTLQVLLGAWLRQESVICSIWKNNFYIDIHGKQWMIPVQNGQQALFETAWAVAQKALALPTVVSQKKLSER